MPTIWRENGAAYANVVVLRPGPAIHNDEDLLTPPRHICHASAVGRENEVALGNPVILRAWPAIENNESLLAALHHRSDPATI